MSKKTLPLLAAACAAVLLTGCETTNMRMGSADAKTVATAALTAHRRSGVEERGRLAAARARRSGAERVMVMVTDVAACAAKGRNTKS